MFWKRVTKSCWILNSTLFFANRVRVHRHMSVLGRRMFYHCILWAYAVIWLIGYFGYLLWMLWILNILWFELLKLSAPLPVEQQPPPIKGSQLPKEHKLSSPYGTSNDVVKPRTQARIGYLMFCFLEDCVGSDESGNWKTNFMCLYLGRAVAWLHLMYSFRIVQEILWKIFSTYMLEDVD